MNEELKAQHYERITSPEIRKLYDNLCNMCAEREGGLMDSDQMLIRDVCLSEQIKNQLHDDVIKRGVGQDIYNGRQHYHQENKSLAQIRSFTEQQRKLLSELRLTPAARKTATLTITDDFDSFE